MIKTYWVCRDTRVVCQVLSLPHPSVVGKSLAGRLTSVVIVLA